MLLPTVVFLAGQAAAFGFGFDKARAFASTADGRYKISPYEAPVRGDGTPNNESTWKLSIDDTPSGFKQRVTGFGAALTETTVDVFNQLPKHRLEKLLREIMTNEGNSFGVIRHTIGSSDLSPEPAMSYDDNGGNAGHVDLTLSHFNIDPRGRAMAKMLKSMRDLNNDMTILGSCWSPPGWMKWDGMFVGAGNNTLDHAYSKQYGDYFVRYIQAYEEIGAHIDAITIQNEPLNNNSGMPSMVIEAAEEGGLIHNHVAPSLREAGFDTEIWAWDHNTDHPYYPQTVLDMNPNLVNTVAWHCYANPIIWEVLTEFYHNNSHIPGFRQFMTECWTSNEYTGWNQAADFTMGPMQNWAEGALAWTLATNTHDGPCLDTPGACCSCTGLVVVNTTAGTYDFTINYYTMGQFSRFMPRGAVVLEGTGSYTYSSGGGIESVASINPDQTRSVVIINKFSNPVYITLETKSGESWSGLVETESVTTWILPPLYK